MKEHTSYELAKRLHELGFRAEHNNVYDINNKRMTRLCDMAYEPDYEWAFVPSYTFTELFHAIPEWIKTDGVGFALEIVKHDDNISIGYELAKYTFTHESPTECAGLMVEWLISNNHLEVSNG